MKTLTVDDIVELQAKAHSLCRRYCDFDATARHSPACIEMAAALRIELRQELGVHQRSEAPSPGRALSGD